jgi:hypothetical protein
LRDHSHIPLEDSDVCAHCGQPLPGRNVVIYGQRGPNRTGIAVTIGLHLLLVLVWLVQPKVEKHAPPKSGAAVVWLPPLKQNKPAAKPAEQAPKKTAQAAAPKFTQPRITMPRLPNTITLPDVKVAEEKPQPTPPKEETKAPPQEVDMQAYIEAQRKRRGAPAQTDQAEESEAARGTRNALANIAAINGRGGQDPNETGGVFSVNNKTFNSADLKFRVGRARQRAGHRDRDRQEDDRTDPQGKDRRLRVGFAPPEPRRHLVGTAAGYAGTDELPVQGNVPGIQTAAIIFIVEIRETSAISLLLH